MIRAAALAIILLLIVGTYAYVIAWLSRKERERQRRGLTVIEDTIQERARENYLLLDRTMDFITGMLAQDEQAPIFSANQREQLVELRAEFMRNQLPPG